MKEPLQREPGGVGSGILVIVLAGVALGLGYNYFQMAANPSRALTWVRHDKPLVSLESLQDSMLASGAQPATWPAEDPAAAAVDPSTPVSSTDQPGAKPAAKQPVAPAKQPAATPAGSGTQPAVGKPAAPAPAKEAAKEAPKLPVIPDVKEPLEVKLETVKLFHDAGAAVIVDARDPSEYAEGHIAGAVLLSFDQAVRDPSLMKKFESGGKPVIVYCGGGDCELSKNLGSMLIEAGHKKVLVYMGGYPEWKSAGYPVAKAAVKS